MAHFQSGLNPEVRDVVELQEYVELDDYALVWWNKNRREMMREEG